MVNWQHFLYIFFNRYCHLLLIWLKLTVKVLRMFLKITNAIPPKFGEMWCILNDSFDSFTFNKSVY